MTTSITTVQELADACGVNRRRIAKWRALPADPAPADLDPAAWLAWLGLHRRRKAHESLQAHQAPPAPVAPAAAATLAPASQMSDLGGDCPPLLATLVEQEAWWRAKGMREKALAAGRIRQEAERSLVPVVVVERALAGLASAAVEALGVAVWHKMRPALDGIAAERPDLLRRLRIEHDAGVRAVRATLAARVPDILTKAFQELPS